MPSAFRHVPTAYQELHDAVTGVLYPAERPWIDFKREFYPAEWPPEAQKAAAEREKKHRDLGCDMAAMAVREGWLALGLQEEKGSGAFTPYPIELFGGLREKIDALARSRVTPSAVRGDH